MDAYYGKVYSLRPCSFTAVKPYKKGDVTYNALRKGLTDFVYQKGHPVWLVNDRAFQELLKLYCPQMPILTSRQIKETVSEITTQSKYFTVNHP